MEIRVDTSTIFHTFNEHFNSNERILFSGNFGSGKTTFLTEFFEKRKDCNVFSLYPVSYASSANEDIFELIKYDLLLTLIENYEESIQLINEDFSNVLSFQFAFLFQAQWSPILFKIIQLADVTGRGNALEKLLNMVKEQYQDYKAKFKDEQADIENFMFKNYSKAGSPRENDLISQLIKELLQRVKTNTKFKENDEDENEEIEKENVLIIDDLDRLDPDHIFRLFNIFSVNFGKDEVSNKFGFDKIIFVCDIKNIREIYAHKYGKRTDFEGYIDKFYSSAPFNFTTNDLLHKYLRDFLFKFKLPHQTLPFNQQSHVEYNPVYVVLKAILNALIATKKINLRSLLNNNFFQCEEKLINLGGKQRLNNSYYPIYIILLILRTIYDTDDNLKQVISDLENFDKNRFRREADLLHIYEDDAYQLLVDCCIPFLIDNTKIENITKDLRSSTQEITTQQFLPILNVFIEFSVFESRTGPIRGTNYQYNFIKFYHEGNANEQVQINPFRILLETYKRMLSITSF